MTFGAKNIWYKVTCRHLIVNLLQNSDFFYSAHNMNSLGVFCFVFVFFFFIFFLEGGGVQAHIQCTGY